jgi:hypothetical protein
MKLNVKAIAIAEAVVAGILFVLCRLAFTLAPDTTLAAMKYLFHTDWTDIAVPVTWGGFFLGLVVFMAFTAVVGAVWAWFYNHLARETRATPLEVTTTKSERAAA